MAAPTRPRVPPPPAFATPHANSITAARANRALTAELLVRAMALPVRAHAAACLAEKKKKVKEGRTSEDGKPRGGSSPSRLRPPALAARVPLMARSATAARRPYPAAPRCGRGRRSPSARRATPTLRRGSGGRRPGCGGGGGGGRRATRARRAARGRPRPGPPRERAPGARRQGARTRAGRAPPALPPSPPPRRAGARRDLARTRAHAPACRAAHMKRRMNTTLDPIFTISRPVGGSSKAASQRSGVARGAGASGPIGGFARTLATRARLQRASERLSEGFILFLFCSGQCTFYCISFFEVGSSRASTDGRWWDPHLECAGSNLRFAALVAGGA